MTFGARLQQIRKAAGLSQEQLAELINMSRQAVSKWETNQAAPDVEKVTLLCEIFKISADELLGNEQFLQQNVQDGRLEQCVKMNTRKRLFTAGWITALTGTVLLILEYFSLFLLRAMEIRLDSEKGNSLGFFNDPMQYASIQPMPAIFGITIAMIVIGIVAAAFGAVTMCSLQKQRPISGFLNLKSGSNKWG
ncbi:MAG: helix-turn-helix transcriptional regulator [Lachnospiraceae bacterium]|jgi:transcriptional regulator with XRE-family HTH domain|nr:helix-turn-helix transcriptional regulator [Lachnospiraceae bacterium]MCI9480582.1 helix-turn-helix transcriptional regulator [Lachnospiraceae bacterium]